MKAISDQETELQLLLVSAKALAKRYKELTGRPLGITGEVAEYETCRVLGLALANVRQSGYDALGKDGTKYQIKARCIHGKANPGQRMGSIKLDKEWDSVLLSILNADLELLGSTKLKELRLLRRSLSLVRCLGM